MLLRQALVRLVATPMFTIFAVVSLAAGVAITTAVYSVVDALLVADLGVDDAERVAFVSTPVGGRTQASSLSRPDFDDLRAAQSSFSAVAASLPLLPSVTTTTIAEVLTAEAVDGAYFSTLAVGAQLGRVIQQADLAGDARVAVLSSELWRNRFAGRADVLGRIIRVNGQPFEVIGVAPPAYRGLLGGLRTTRLWIPLSAGLDSTAAAAGENPRERRGLLVFGRLAPNSTAASASAELTAIAARLDQSHPQTQVSGRVGPNPRRWSARPVTDTGQAGDTNRRFGLMLVALVALVLVVACTNLANLVLARGAARQGELAVRMAMGASRGRLIWEQCVESLILAAAGMAASYGIFLVLAAVMTTEFTFGFGPVRASLAIRPVLDPRALAVALASTLLALAVFGLEPAVQLARTLDIRSALARGASGGRPRVGRQRLVIRWQVAIATGFFIVATMFIRGTWQLARHDTGVEIDRIAVAALNFRNGPWDEGRIRRTIDRVLEELRHQPAVDTVAASTGLPFGVMPGMEAAIALPDDAAALTRPPVAALAVTPMLFRTLGTPIVRGRAFNDSDGAAAAPVVILSELTATQIFGSREAVGRSLALRHGGRDVLAEVIGIARDTDVSFVYSQRRPLVYLPLSQHFADAITVTARAGGGDAAAAVAALREAIRRADPDLAVDVIGTGGATLAGPFALLRAGGLATLYLGGFTLLLSMVGLFGVQANVVAHRTREIGVRMSLGATAAQIKLMVMKDGYRPVIEGLVLGLWGGLAARLLVRAYMDVDVAVIDPWMLVVAPIPLVLAAFSACYVPAARAAGVDPTVALRAE
ncbi:MAG: ABC transporter permease [Vicinamibacterales bacterium]